MTFLVILLQLVQGYSKLIELISMAGMRIERITGKPRRVQKRKMNEK